MGAAMGLPRDDLPEGYQPFQSRSPFLDWVGPVYSKANPNGLSITIWVDGRHCNSRGIVHGGVISTLIDVALGYSAGHGVAGAKLTTVALNLEFLSPALPGQWIVCEGALSKHGRTVAHASCLVTSTGRTVARGAGIFAVQRDTSAEVDRQEFDSSKKSE